MAQTLEKRHEGEQILQHICRDVAFVDEPAEESISGVEDLDVPVSSYAQASAGRHMTVEAWGLSLMGDSL